MTVSTTKVWKEVIDPSTRSIYFWNVETGETTWERRDDDVLGNGHPENNAESLDLNPADSPNRTTERKNRIDQFFEEIKFIRRTCDSLLENETPSAHEIEELIQSSLDGVESILEISTPNTKTYNKFDSVKRSLIEYNKILKRYRNLDTFLIEQIIEDKKEIERTLENIRGLDVVTSNIFNDYQVYIKRKKQDTNRQKWLNFAKNKLKVNSNSPSIDHVCIDINLNTPEIPKENENPQSRASERIKAIHKKWNRAAEVIEYTPPQNTITSTHDMRDEENNPNLVPIITPWWKHLDENKP